MAVGNDLKILIVDDSREMLGVLRTVLRRMGFGNVEEATDGSGALEKLRAGDFGLIVSDWSMEPMTGMQLLREVRADQRLRCLPFVMVTAETKRENVVEAEAEGVSAYIMKPFDAATFNAALKDVLGEF